MTICQHCGADFVKASGVQKYCTRTCLKAARDPKGPLKEISCKGCSTKFVTTNRLKEYCGPDCRVRHLNSLRPTSKTEIRNCVVCGNEFQPMQKTGVGRKWCSEACKHVMGGNPQRLARFLSDKQVDPEVLQAARDSRQKYGLMKTFGLTVEQYNEMHERQNGLCAICKSPETAKSNFDSAPRKLAVDHCHSTGKIRALLCTTCNTALGGFKDDPRLIQAAIEYLKHHSEKSNEITQNSYADNRGPQTEKEDEPEGLNLHERS